MCDAVGAGAEMIPTLFGDAGDVSIPALSWGAGLVAEGAGVEAIPAFFGAGGQAAQEAPPALFGPGGAAGVGGLAAAAPNEDADDVPMPPPAAAEGFRRGRRRRGAAPGSRPQGAAPGSRSQPRLADMCLCLECSSGTPETQVPPAAGCRIPPASGSSVRRPPHNPLYVPSISPISPISE